MCKKAKQYEQLMWFCEDCKLTVLELVKMDVGMTNNTKSQQAMTKQMETLTEGFKEGGTSTSKP